MHKSRADLEEATHVGTAKNISLNQESDDTKADGDDEINDELSAGQHKRAGGELLGLRRRSVEIHVQLARRLVHPAIVGIC